jgi:SAM-dependent methyltransferase
MLDQLVRFAPALRLLDDLGGGTLLEVGSGSRGLGAWLDHRWQVTAADVSFDDYGSASGAAVPAVTTVVADARDLPFDDRSFDAAVSIDMLEHIAADDRPRVLSELARVARRRVVIACPTGAAALAADHALAEDYRRRGRDLPPWLAEHLDIGFPEPEELGRGLAPFGRVRLVPNESVATHGLLMRVQGRHPADHLSHAIELALTPGIRRRGPRGFADVALRVLRGFDRRPSYRTLAVLDR